MKKIQGLKQPNNEAIQKLAEKVLELQLLRLDSFVKEIDLKKHFPQLDCLEEAATLQLLKELQKRLVIREARLKYFDRLIDILRKRNATIESRALADNIEGWFLYRVGLYEYCVQEAIVEENFELLKKYLDDETEKLKYQDLKEIHVETHKGKTKVKYKERIGKPDYYAIAPEWNKLKGTLDEIKKQKPKNKTQAVELLRKKLPEYEWDEDSALIFMTGPTSELVYEILSEKYNRSVDQLKREIGKINQMTILLKEYSSLRKSNQPLK